MEKPSDCTQCVNSKILDHFCSGQYRGHTGQQRSWNFFLPFSGDFLKLPSNFGAILPRRKPKKKGWFPLSISLIRYEFLWKINSLRSTGSRPVMKGQSNWFSLKRFFANSLRTKKGMGTTRSSSGSFRRDALKHTRADLERSRSKSDARSRSCKVTWYPSASCCIPVDASGRVKHIGTIPALCLYQEYLIGSRPWMT